MKKNLLNFYYHVTPVENIESIKKNGLKANEEGGIYLFSPAFMRIPSPVLKSENSKEFELGWALDDTANNIARNQILRVFNGEIYSLGEYAIFEINSAGITGELSQDEVAELFHIYQYVVTKQEKIDPEFIRFVQVRQTYQPVAFKADYPRRRQSRIN
ncbi:MAG: hypothetical protein IJL04_01025 [Bacteroidales bacterium]|nr:hypothetical protein [Bacteroidales bacterium]MBQ6100855.1 hypothetical protein [Bacteroidales bacterium]